MPSQMTPAERTLRAQLAAHASWAHTTNPTARTAPGRQAFLARFEQEVDPDGALDPADRRRRAEHARRAYMAKLAMRSSQARRRRREPAEHDDGSDVR